MTGWSTTAWPFGERTAPAGRPLEVPQPEIHGLGQVRLRIREAIFLEGAIVTARECREMVREWLSEGTFDERLPEVSALRRVPQPEEYHGEGDAFIHTMLAMEAVDDDADPRVFWGALLHDIGKSAKTVFEGGRWRSVGHAEAGAEMVPAVMERIGLPDLTSDVVWLVKHHLFHFSWNLG
ncbi:MAG: HD domain-containing protein, partial [Geobacteraceae bacterium]|nr:HD domain-containing protein [Geobacteraceae bacterium]